MLLNVLYSAFLGEPGSVSFQFDLKGVIQVSKKSLHEYGSALEIAIHIGAEDVKCVECEGQEGKRDYYVFLCDVQVRNACNAHVNIYMHINACGQQGKWLGHSFFA